MRDGRRIEQHPEDWIEQLAKKPEQSVRRVVEAGFVEGIGLRGGRRRGIDRHRPLTSTSPQLVQQLRLESPRIENRLETPRGKLLDLLVRQVDAAALRDAPADLPHDLFDIDAIVPLGAAHCLGRRTPPLEAAPIGATTPAVEVTATSLIVIHRHCVNTF